MYRSDESCNAQRIMTDRSEFTLIDLTYGCAVCLPRFHLELWASLDARLSRYRVLLSFEGFAGSSMIALADLPLFLCRACYTIVNRVYHDVTRRHAP